MAIFSKNTKILLLILAILVAGLAGFKLYQLLTSRNFQAPSAPTSKLNQKALNASTLLENAEQLFKQNRLNESLALYEQALKVSPNDSQIHNNIGLVLLEKNSLTESEKALLKAIELEPGCSECHNNLGLLKSQQNQFESAEKHFKMAILLNEKNPEPYYNLGVLYEKNGDIGSAVDAYEDFLRHTPNKKSVDALEVQNRILTLKGK